MDANIEQELEALKINEKRLQDKIKWLGDVPENAQAVTRAKLHLLDLQREIKKRSPSTKK